MPPRRYTALTFTPSVQEAQDHYGARAVADKMARSPLNDRDLTWREQDFLAQRDSFYMASVGETGWPYLQFRGGPPGFLKVVDAQTLAYADLSGNRQYISTGNLRRDDRAALFFMDYPNRRRLKLMARATIRDAEAVRTEEPELLARVTEGLDPKVATRVERVVVFRVEAYDWNCPQHITPRFTLAELEAQGS